MARISDHDQVTDRAPASDSRPARGEHTTAATIETPTVPANQMDDKTGDDDCEPHLFPVLPAKDVLRDWAKRLSRTQISQADSSKPAKLSPAEENKQQPFNIPRGDNIPLHASAPQIIISRPEDTSTPVLPETQPETRISLFSNDKKGVPSKADAELHIHRQAPKRRRTINPGTKKNAAPASASQDCNNTPHVPLHPSRWKMDCVGASPNCKMKTRHSTIANTEPAVDIVLVYIYNSTMYDELNDPDGDLDLFRSIPISDSPSGRLQGVLRDFATDSTFAALAPVDKENKPVHGTNSSSSGTASANWITDDNMLSKHIPESRVITVGFDMATSALNCSNSTWASYGLLSYLHRLRGESETPLIFLGHTLGGLIVLEAFILGFSGVLFDEQMLWPTAGVLLFSCPTRTPAHTSTLTLLHKIDLGVGVFEDVYGSEMRRISAHMRSSIFPVVQSHRQPGDKVFTAKANPNRKKIVTGFPVVQILTHDDLKPTVEDAFDDFIGVPSQTMVVFKEASQAVRFSGPEDTDFKQVVEIIKETLSGRRLILAAITGNCNDIDIMLKARMNPNLGDRWGQTPLHFAVRLDQENVVCALLDFDKIDVNARDINSNTALHHAIRMENEHVITTLLHHGADVTTENWRGHTPRDLAERRKSRKPFAKILESRLVNGPDTNLITNRLSSGAPPSSESGIMACTNFQITGTELYTSGTSDTHWSVNISVASLLYGKAHLLEILDQNRPKEVKGQRPICTWIHVPENNMLWVEELFARLGVHNAIWQETQKTINKSLRNRAITPHVAQNVYNTLFMPYVSYEANRRQMKRADYIQTTNKQRRATANPFARKIQRLAPFLRQQLKVPVVSRVPAIHAYREDSDSETHHDEGTANDSDDLEEEEKASISTYLNDPPALHVRRTLDQYYYHMLESTADRDRDQVVSRWVQKEAKDIRHNILMVDQLWLWMSRPTTYASPISENHGAKTTPNTSQGSEAATTQPPQSFIVTSFPNRSRAGPRMKQDNLRVLVLDPMSRKRDVISQPQDLISRILETCCSAFDRLQDEELLRFFQMFESSIGSVDDKESCLFRTFQTEASRLLELDPANKYYSHNKNTLLVSMLDIREEIKLLVEIKDIRDEVNIIRSVLNVQKALMDQMSRAEGPDSMLPRNSAVSIMVNTDISDFKKLDDQAKSVQDKLNTLMDLKQKAANAWEAREARETAVAASKQGNIVLVFTIVTIIFLPLSFMSAFFTIGISTFPKDPISGETSWPIGMVTSILCKSSTPFPQTGANNSTVGGSLSVSIPLIVFALNMESCSSLYNELRYNHLAHLGVKILTLLPGPKAIDNPNSRRTKWIAEMEKCREQYLKADAGEDTAHSEDNSAKNLADAMLNAARPARSHFKKVVRPGPDDSEPPRRFARLRKFRKRTDKENGSEVVDSV